MDQDSLAALIEFIGKKFDQVDQRFGAMETKIADARRPMVEGIHRDYKPGSSACRFV